MNSLPATYPKVPLGTLLELKYGAALPDTFRSGVGYPVFGSNGVVGRHSSYLVEGPGIVVGRKGSMGQVCWSDEPFWPIDTAYYVAPKGHNSLRWLYWLLSSLNLKSLDAATGVPGLNRNDVYTVGVYRPESAEQSRIARVLDALDEAIAKTEAMIAKLKHVRSGLLHDLLTRGLDEHGQLRDPIAHPEQFKASPLGRIPKEWEVGSVESLLARVASAMRSGPFGSALLKQELKDSGIPLLGIDNVHVEHFIQSYSRFVDDDKYQELKRYAVRPKDVMITIMGTVGRCCVVPDSIGLALSSKHVWTISLDQSRYSPEVACWQINFTPWVLRQFRRDEQGGVMTAIRSDTLRQLQLPVPPPDEMQAIEAALRLHNEGIRAEKAALSKMLAVKSGLMTDLLSGRVRVPDDPIFNKFA